MEEASVSQAFVRDDIREEDNVMCAASDNVCTKAVRRRESVVACIIQHEHEVCEGLKVEQTGPLPIEVFS